MPTYKTLHTLHGLQVMAAAESTGTPINLTLVAVALGYVLASHGETALLAAGCVLYVGICGWNWKQHSKGASKC